IDVTGTLSGTSYLSPATVTITAPSNEIWVRINKGSVGPWELYEGPIELTTAGNYAVFAKTVDPGGVESEIVQRNLTITTLFDDPVLEFAGDGIDPYYKWIEITLDFDPSAPQPRYRMNGGAWQTYTEPMLFEQPGNFLIEYRNGSTQPIFSK